MSLKIDTTIKSNLNLAFTIDLGKTDWYNGEIKQAEDFLSNTVKHIIPKKQIFQINALVFNIETQRKEVYTKFNCYFDNDYNSLLLVINDNARYVDFSKEIMMNLFDFVQKAKMSSIYLLISKTNKQYIRIMQGMLTIGFENDENVKTTMIDDKIYKVIKMNVEGQSDVIEEVDF